MISPSSVQAVTSSTSGQVFSIARVIAVHRELLGNSANTPFCVVMTLVYHASTAAPPACAAQTPHIGLVSCKRTPGSAACPQSAGWQPPKYLPLQRQTQGTPPANIRCAAISTVISSLPDVSTSV
jgi:hypothetical protein